MDAMMHPVPGAVTGVQLLAISIVTFTWGLLAVVDGVHAYRRGLSPLLTFSTSLGIFLIVSDGGLYFILSYDVLNDGATVPLWGAIYIWACFGWALVAFRQWARIKA